MNSGGVLVAVSTRSCRLKGDKRRTTLPGYKQIPSAATELKTDTATLLDFSRRGWINTVEKNGSVFIASSQRYRARYILYLRQKKSLSDDEIELLLSVQRPPYSAADVDRILREHRPAASSAETRQPGTDKRRIG